MVGAGNLADAASEDAATVRGMLRNGVAWAGDHTQLNDDEYAARADAGGRQHGPEKIHMIMNGQGDPLLQKARQGLPDGLGGYTTALPLRGPYVFVETVGARAKVTHLRA